MAANGGINLFSHSLELSMVVASLIFQNFVTGYGSALVRSDAPE